MAPTTHVFSVVLLLLLGSTQQMCWARHVLYSGESLLTNEYLNNGPFTFVCQNDCNLVIYENSRTGGFWQTDTSGRGKNCVCTMQSDGNFVAKDEGGKTVWSTTTGGAAGHYALILRNDGKLAVYGPSAWSNYALTKTITVHKPYLAQ